MPERPYQVSPLRRLPWIGHSRYATRDGRFTIEQAANGAGSWTIHAADIDSDLAERVLVVSDADRSFSRLRDAREWLAGSAYSWFTADADEVERYYQEALYKRVSDV